MEIFRKIWISIKNPLAIVGTICSIASLVCLCFKEQTAVWWALGFLGISALILLVYLLMVLNRFLEKNDSENHKCVATFIRYRTDDGTHIEYEVHKLIQVMCSIMHKFDTGFSWSGTSNPQWQSSLQDVERVETAQAEGKYDKLFLSMKEPALYGQTKVIHFKANIDDAQKTSSPHVELRVEYPTELVQFTIALGYKDSDFHESARVERALIHSDIPAQYKSYGSVVFDRIHKQYVYHLVNPQPGYFYRISWDR